MAASQFHDLPLAAYHDGHIQERSVYGRMDDNPFPAVDKRVTGHIHANHHAGHEDDLFRQNIPVVLLFYPLNDNFTQAGQIPGIPKYAVRNAFL
jgi:hypothetical protein